MTQKYIIELELLTGLADGKEELISAITDAVTENELKFHERMKFTSSQKNGLADPFEGSLEVSEIIIEDSETGIVYAEWEYEAYNPCEDLHQRKDDQDKWKFKLKGTEVIFDFSVPQEPYYEI